MIVQSICPGAAVDYPYPVNLFWIMLGKSRVHLVVFFDSRENFYGKNDLYTLLTAKDQSQSRQELLEMWTPTVAKLEEFDEMLMPEQSYPGPQ